MKIEVENLTVHYRSRRLFSTEIHTALEDVSFSVEPGEVVVLPGRNGAGKSTLLRVLCGLIKPTKGSVRYDGESIEHMLPSQLPVRLTERRSLYEHFSVGKNIVYYLQLNGVSEKECAERLVAVSKQLDITHLLDRRAEELSAGEEQRVIIARMMAVAREKRILFFDEALAHIDPESTEVFRNMFLDLFEQYGSTVLYVTHDRHDALRVCKRAGGRMLYLYQGRIEQYALASEMIQRPASDVVREYLSDWYWDNQKFYNSFLSEEPEGGVS